jgi:hypothetical protein
MDDHILMIMRAWYNLKNEYIYIILIIHNNIFLVFKCDFDH